MNDTTYLDFAENDYKYFMYSYYFNTGYPGDNSFFVSRDDIEICKEGLEACRNLVLVLDKKWKKESDDKEVISKDTLIIEDEEWDI